LEAAVPYESIQALPEQLRQNLPLRAQQIYRDAFNAAWRQYIDFLSDAHPAALEEAVSRSAWAAVRRHYWRDGATGRWRLMSTI
jgi:cation transport regulator